MIVNFALTIINNQTFLDFAHHIAECAKSRKFMIDGIFYIKHKFSEPYKTDRIIINNFL